MTDYTVECEDVEFGYEPGQTILNGINLTLEPGRISVFCGGNGTGKSTMMKLISGLLNPRTGRIHYTDETGYVLNRSEVKFNSVYVNQEPYVLKGNVYQNISLLMPPSGRGKCDNRKPDKHEIISKALEMTGLGGFEKKKASILSGGEKKRLAISRALAAEKRILLLDEPTANVDAESSGLLRKHLFILKETGMTILIATHDRNFADTTADIIYDLNNRRKK